MTTEHTFQALGDYTVLLTVTDDQGDTDSVNQIVTVEAGPVEPVAYFDVSPLVGNHPLTVNFDASGTNLNGAQISEYRWEFGDGYSLYGLGAGAIYPEHNYPGPGSFTARLTVTATGGEQYIFERQILVNAPPVAAFTSSAALGYAPLQVAFDASASNDSDDEIVEYRWSFGNGETGSGITTENEYQESGTYHPSLTVIDSLGGQHTTNSTIVVEDATTVATPVINSESGSTTENPVLITGSGTPTYTIDVLVNGSIRASGTVDGNGDFAILTPLTNGSNTIHVVSSLDSVSSGPSNSIDLVYQNSIPQEIGNQIIDSLMVLTVRESNEPYVVSTGDLEISQSGKLVVSPGVKINVSNSNWIRITGSLEMGRHRRQSNCLDHWRVRSLHQAIGLG